MTTPHKPTPPIAQSVTVVIPMDYPGKDISKNRLFHGGNRRWGMNGVAATWKDCVHDSLVWSLAVEHEGIVPTLPVHVEIACRFVDKRHAIDASNCIEICLDAVESGLRAMGGKWNDRDFTVSTKPNEYGVDVPEIVVSVTVGVAG